MAEQEEKGNMEEGREPPTDVKPVATCYDPVAVLRGHSGRILKVEFSSDGSVVLMASSDSTARLWDVASQSCVAILEHRGVRCASFSPDDSLVATSGLDGRVFLWNVASRTRIAAFRAHSRVIWEVSFSPGDNGKWLATASSDGTARLWCVESQERLGTFRSDGASEVFTARFSPCGSQLLTADDNGTVKIWCLQSECVTKVENPNAGDGRACISPDGSLVAMTSLDGTVRLWSRIKGCIVATLEGHLDTVMACEFTPDGSHLVTGSADDAARVWSIHSPHATCVSILRAHAKAVRSVAVSCDSRMIATASSDRTLCLWNMPSLTNTPPAEHVKYHEKHRGAG